MRRGKDGSKAREQKPWCGGSTHSFQDADGLLAEPDWVEHVIVEDGLKQVVLVVSLEGGLPGHHLIHQHPQGPPVHGGAILQLLQDLLRKWATSEPTKDSHQRPRLCHKCPWAEPHLHFQLAAPRSGAPCYLKLGSQSASSVEIELGRRYAGGQLSNAGTYARSSCGDKSLFLCLSTR